MATIEEALVAILNANAAFNALVAGRLYPSFIPQTAARPAVAYQRISHIEAMAHTGYAGMAQTRVQFTIDAQTYASAKAVAAALRAAVRGYRGTAAGVTIGAAFVETENDGYSDTTQTPVVRTDVIFHHNGD